MVCVVLIIGHALRLVDPLAGAALSVLAVFGFASSAFSVDADLAAGAGLAAGMSGVIAAAVSTACLN